MAAETVIVDTGPLVALLRADDLHHSICRDVTRELRPPLVTTWPVITEAAWLLRNTPDGVDRLLQLLEAGLVQCYELDIGCVSWLRSYLENYADLGPQLADVSLVYCADALESDVIFTLDRRDFVVFRNRHGRPFRLLPETL